MKIQSGFLAILIFYLAFFPAFAFNLKNPFKKNPKEKQKMVETKQEWEIEAQNVPLEERKEKKSQEKENKKFYTPPARYVFEKYNYPQGKRELNIETIKKNLFSYPYIATDINCQYAAYPRYYFSPSNNQISSEFFVEKLDTSKTKTKRILEYNHDAKIRTPVIKAGLDINYPNLFNSLTLVDFSRDGRKILVKERIGSTLGGIYKTFLHIYFLENNSALKLVDFDEAIKEYFTTWQNLQIIKYRYIVEPLGFSAENDDIIISLLWAYDKDNRRLFLGTWGYNCESGETILISKTNPITNLSINGLILKQVVD